MSTPYAPRVEPVQDGEAINAAITNRPIQQLTQRTDATNEVVQGALFGSAMVIRQAPLNSAVLVGTPVFLSQGIYEPAQYAFDVDQNQEYSVSRSSWCAGVVSWKQNSTLGDIVTMGMCTISGDQLSAVTQSGTPETGQLFLSSAAPGKLTAMSPPVGIQVAFCDGPDADNNYVLLVAPFPRNTVEQHIHYRVGLSMIEIDPTTGMTIPPDTSPPSSSGSTIVFGDGLPLGDTLPVPAGPYGWVDTTAYADWFAAVGIPIPAGATWYYWPDRDPLLSRLWPPRPIGVASLERNGIGLRLDGTNPDAVIDEFGIWYLRSTASPVAGGTIAADSGFHIAGGPPDRIDILFIKLFGKTNVITSLDPADNTIVITDPRGQKADTGALLIRAQLPLDTSDNTPGYTGVKVIDGMIQKRGVILEGLKNTDGSLVLTGGTAVSEGFDAGGGAIAATGFLGGRIIINSTNPGYPVEGSLQAMAFDGVDIINNGGIYTHTFRSGQVGSIRGYVRIPTSGVPTDGLSLKFEMTVLGKANGTLPALDFSVRHLPQAAAECTATNLPSTDSVLSNLDFSTCGSITANQYVRKSTDALTVLPGDILYVEFTRNTGDGYAGNLGVLDVKYTLDPL